jgi:hypothetical protein
MKERKEQPAEAASLAYCLRPEPAALRDREEVREEGDCRRTLLDFFRDKGRELREAEEREEAEKKGPGPRRRSLAGPALCWLLKRSTWGELEEIGGKGWEAEFIALAYASVEGRKKEREKERATARGDRPTERQTDPPGGIT